MGWAALMALTIALFSVRVALDANGHSANGAALVPAAIAIGSIATLAFLADCAILVRRDVLSKRAGRLQPPKYGQLDYAPEFLSAVTAYTTAQGAINEATTAAANVVRQNSPLTEQHQANAAASAIDGLVATMRTSIPIMDEKALAMKVCLRGIFTLPVDRKTERQTLENFKPTVTNSRQQTEGMRRTLTALRQTMRTVRAGNRAISLNTAVDAYMVQLAAYERVAGRAIRAFRDTERRAAWRIFRARFRSWLVLARP